MIYYTDEMIDRLIKEDVPYIDLTTTVLDIGTKVGKIEFIVREDGVVACTEEAEKVCQKLGVKVTQCIASGAHIPKGTVILSGEGNAHSLHMAWKVCLNILEYCCGISTNAKLLIDKVKGINPDVSVVITRKSFPGTKELIVKAALSGGVLPHRLGLSETVLIFEQHRNFIGGIDGLVKMIPDIKNKCCEKKVIVEVENIEDAIKIANSGVDGIQFDKIPYDDLSEYVQKIRGINSNITLIGAGGININNVEQYAGTGVNAIATSAIFHGKPLDIGVKMVCI